MCIFLYNLTILNFNEKYKLCVHAYMIYIHAPKIYLSVKLSLRAAEAVEVYLMILREQDSVNLMMLAHLWLLRLQGLHDQRDQAQDGMGRCVVVARGGARDQCVPYLQALKLTYF